MKEQQDTQDNSPKAARERRFKLTGEPSPSKGQQSRTETVRDAVENKATQKSARKALFATTGEISEAPDLNDIDATGDQFRKPCKTGGKVVTSGAFSKLEDIPESPYKAISKKK
jgi:hypothetical protein